MCDQTEFDFVEISPDEYFGEYISDEVESWSFEDETTVFDGQDDDADLWIYSAIDFEEYLNSYIPNRSFSPCVIFEALCMSGSNYELAVQVIINATLLIDTCKPCRHMLTNKCYRKDCHFDHDISHIPCKFWMSSSGCIVHNQGGQCPYLHQLPSEHDHSYLYEKYYQRLSNAATTSDSTFITSTTTITTITNSQPNQDNQSAQILDMDFPTLPSNNINNNHHKSKSQSTATNSTSKEQSKLSKADEIYQSLFGHNTYKNNTINHDSDISQPFKSSSSMKLQTVKMKHDAVWVNSGKSVSTKYHELRSQARIHAVARNKLLSSATQTYLSGDKQQAAELSYEGQIENNKMKECHHEASKLLFHHNNPLDRLIKGQIDCHGLHVDEIITILTDILPCYNTELYQYLSPTCISADTNSIVIPTTHQSNYLSKENIYKLKSQYLSYVDIITGTGHHSHYNQPSIGTTATATASTTNANAISDVTTTVINGSKNNTPGNDTNTNTNTSISRSSRLFAAVKDYLIQYEFVCKIIKDKNGYYAGFRVYLR